MRIEVGAKKRKSEVRCGVVGNIQASHVCAPGSIPGDGVFLEKKEKKREKGIKKKKKEKKCKAGWRSGSAAGS